MDNAARKRNAFDDCLPLDDEPASSVKRCNTGRIKCEVRASKRPASLASSIETRRPRKNAGGYANPLGGTASDPLNLNPAIEAPDKFVTDFVLIAAFFCYRKLSNEALIAATAVQQRRQTARAQTLKRRGGVESVTTPALADSNVTSAIEALARREQQNKMRMRYRYGNYNYHSRQLAPFQNDARLDLLCDDWFKGKNVRLQFAFAPITFVRISGSRYRLQFGKFDAFNCESIRAEAHSWRRVCKSFASVIEEKKK